MQDLLACLDKDFPRGTELTPLQKEWEAHEAFAEARRRVYIGRNEYFEKVEDYVAQRKNTPLVIVGESGTLFISTVYSHVNKI